MKTANILFFVILIASQSSFAGNYADCILDKMPTSETDAVIGAVIRTCTNENPNTFFEIKKGSGRGLFGFSDANACTLKKARGTTNQRAALIISNACRCLFDAPFFENEMCQARSVPNFVPVEPPKATGTPIPIQISPTTPTTSSSVSPIAIAPQSYKPSKTEMAQAVREKASADKLALDMAKVTDQVLQDYPFLNLQEGQYTVQAIVARRDFYIERGEYPANALSRAVRDIAPFHKLPSALAPAAGKPTTLTEPNPYAVDANGCAWVTPTQWKCK